MSSTENTKTAESLQMKEVAGGELNVCGQPLQYSIRMSFATIIPPIYILTVNYGGKTAHYNFQLNQDRHWEMEVTGPLGIGDGVLIAIGDWTIMGGEESAELKFTGYSALALCGPVTARVNF